MKTFSILWTLVLGVLLFSSCEVEELASPVANVNTDLAAAKNTPQQSIITYGGQATGLNATITKIINGTVVSNQTILSQTGFLPATGGLLTAAYSEALIEGSVSVDSLSASVSSQASKTTAQSFATGVNVTGGGHVITADYAGATATATCGAATGSSQIQNLVIDGTPIVVTGAPNQTVFFPTGGLVIINEQSTSKKIKAKNITITALHIIIPNNADVRIASVRAEIKC